MRLYQKYGVYVNNALATVIPVSISTLPVQSEGRNRVRNKSAKGAGRRQRSYFHRRDFIAAANKRPAERIYRSRALSPRREPGNPGLPPPSRLSLSLSHAELIKV